MVLPAEPPDAQRALIRRPSAKLADGLVTQSQRVDALAAIRYPPLADDPAFFPHFRPMPEEAGSHVVDLGEGRLLMASSAPRSADLIADLGYTPVVVDITEFEKMEGCVTCLSVRLRSAP